jgi:hypothetical protein
MICDCEKIKVRMQNGGPGAARTIDGRNQNKIKNFKLGKFYDLIDENGHIRLGLMNYNDLKFSC